ncbi:MAG: hypothetical protein ABIO44_11045 [Saprospiraceae bacterium]
MTLPKIRRRGIDDPSMLYLVFKISDIAKVKALLTSEAKKKMMQESGVISEPEIFFGRDVK